MSLLDKKIPVQDLRKISSKDSSFEAVSVDELKNHILQLRNLMRPQLRNGAMLVRRQYVINKIDNIFGLVEGKNK